MVARVLQGAGASLLGLGLAGYGVLVTLVAPISTRVFYDPALQYMLASLEVFRGATYSYVDHPGTPVEMLGTLGLALMYPFVSGAPEGFVAYQLGHPAQFMTMAQTFLAVASIATCGLFVRRAVIVSHWSQALAAVGLGGAFFGLHTAALSTLAIWSHTSFCFLGGTLLLLATLVTVRQPKGPRWRAVLALGFACGVLTSVQLYFAAWVVGTAVTITLAARLHGLATRHALRRGEMTIVLAVVGFVVATLPIHDRYLGFASWVVQLSTHQDLYGRGPDGFSSPERLVSNTLTLVQQQPLLFAVTAATLVFALVRILRSSAVSVRAAGAGLAIQTVVLLVLVAKHPASRYLLPVAATVPVLLAALLETSDPPAIAWRRFAAAVGVAGIVLFAQALWTAGKTHVDVADALRRDDSAMGVWLDRIASQRGIDRQSLQTLWTYGTTSPCYALWYGAGSTENLFTNDIGQVCPHDGSLDIAEAHIRSASNDVDVGSAFDWDVEVIPRNLLNAYPRARLPGDVYETELASVTPVDYAAIASDARQPDQHRARALVLIVRH